MPGLFFNSGVDKGFEKDIKRMNTQMNTFSGNVQKKGGAIDNTFRKIGRSVAGIVSIMAVGRAGKELITFTTDLETALTEVSTISQEVTDNFEGTKDSILALSTTSASGAVQLTEALYDIISAGSDLEDGFELLIAAEQASTAGFVEVASAADGLTTVLNAWGKTAKDATKVSDIFFKAVEKGKTTFPELAANIAQVAPLAASLGVSFEEVAGAAASLTKAGTPTAQAMTQIRASLLAMNEVLGDGWAELMTYQEGLQAVRDRAGGSTNKLREMLGRVEAVNAVLGLTGKNAAAAASDLDAMNNSLGATEVAAQKVIKTTEQQVSILKNNILSALAPLGEAGKSFIGNLAKQLNKLFKTRQELSDYRDVLRDIVNNTQNKFEEQLNTSATRLEVLFKRLKATNVGSKLRKDLLNQINIEYGEYLPNLLTEKSSIEEINTAQIKANESLRKNIELKIQHAATEEILINQTKRESKEWTRLTEKYKDAGLKVSQIKAAYEDFLKPLNEQTGEYKELLKSLKAYDEEQFKISENNKKLGDTFSEVQSPIFDLNIAFGAFASQRRKDSKVLEQLIELYGEFEKVGITSKISTPKGTIDLEELRKKALQDLEIDNQKSINLITERFGKEEKLQNKFNRRLLENRLTYLKKLRKLTVNELDKLKIDEQVLIIRTDIKAIKGIDKNQQELDQLLKQFQTYTDRREKIEKDFQKNISTLRKAGYNQEAVEAEKALQDELRRLDKSIIAGNIKFQEWMEESLPQLAKDGIKALQQELQQLELSLLTGGLSPEEILVLKEKINELNEVLADPSKVDSWKDTLEIMNGINEFTSTLIDSFDGLSDTTKSVLTGIAKTASGVIGLITAIKAVKVAVTTLEKASAILAAIGAALQIISAINNTISNIQKAREDVYIRELEKIQATNVLLIKQNQLYEEGNSFFSDDKWGTALSGLKAYNLALEAQNNMLSDIGNIDVRTKTKPGFAKFLGLAGLPFRDQHEDLLKLYPELIKANGELDKGLLKLIIDTEDLTETDKARLENLIELNDLAADSYTQFGDYISSIFGGVADDITEAFQVMFESGDSAMLSLQGSFSDMIETFTRDVIQFTFLQPLLDQMNEITKDLGKRYAAGEIPAEQLQQDIIKTLGDFYDSLNAIQPQILEAFDNADKLAAAAGFEEAFNNISDIIGTDSGEDKSQAGRIFQGVTTEDATLIAGRLGAIMLSNQIISNNSGEILELATRQVVYLHTIAQNSEYLPIIAENTQKTYEKLENV